MSKSNPNKRSLVDTVVSLFNKTPSMLKKTAAIAAIAAAASSSVSCMSPEQYAAQLFLRPKQQESSKSYLKHSDSLSVDDKRPYQLIGFSRADIISKSKFGELVVARLRTSCDDPTHSFDCVEQDILPGGLFDFDGDIMALLKDNVLYLTLAGDNTPVREISYVSSIKEMRRVTYRGSVLENGRVKNPLPSGYSPVGGGRSIIWEDILYLDSLLRGIFNNTSIFTEEDVLEARFHNDPDRYLTHLNFIIKYANNSDISLSRKSARLLEAAEQYKIFDASRPIVKPVEMTDIGAGLKKAYDVLEKEAVNKGDKDALITLNSVRDCLPKEER